MRTSRVWVSTTVAVSLLAGSLSAWAADAPPRTSTSVGTPTPRRAEPRDPRTLPGISTQVLPNAAVNGVWRFIGPKAIANSKSFVSNPPGTYGNVSGRITSIAVDPTNANVVFAGSAGGGVWKTSDGGAHWLPSGNSDTSASLAIGGIGIDATGQQLIVGTGEINGSDAQPGAGLLKSSNGGSTFSLVGTQYAGKHFGTIRFDSTTSGSTAKIYAASDAGLLRSTNGGATWSTMTGLNPHARSGKTASGAVYDIVQDPASTKDFYVVAGDDCATESGDIIKYDSTAGTFTNVLDASNIFSSNDSSRMALAMGTDGRLWVYAADCNGNSLFVASKPAGSSTFTKTTGQLNSVLIQNQGTSQGGYDIAMGVDPTNSQHIVVAGIGMNFSADGGATWSNIGRAYTATGTVHVDFHAIAFTGAQSFYVGSDGGMYRTTNDGGAFSNLNQTLAITQYYNGNAIDLTHLVGGAQDNGISASTGGVPLPAFQQVSIGGDGATGFLDATTGSNYVYTVAQNGYLMRSTVGNFSAFNVATPCNQQNPPTGACNDPTNFITPVVPDPTNPRRILYGTNRVYESKVNTLYTAGLPPGAPGWTAISPPMSVATSVCKSDPLQAIRFAGTNSPNTIIAVTQCGSVFRTIDGTTWSYISGNLPGFSKANVVGLWPWMSDAAINPWNVDEAWVTLSSVGKGHVFHTVNANAGLSTVWSDITGNMPDAPVNTVLVDPRDPNIVYVGTAKGALACTTCGGSGASGSWGAFGNGLPNVWVNQLTFTRDLTNVVAWTHGRGVWSISTPDPAAMITTFALPSGSIPNEIAAGPNGLWYVMRGSGFDAIGLIDRPDGHQQYYSGPSGSTPYSIGAGPDGKMYFAEFTSPAHYGSVTTAGVVTENSRNFGGPLDGIVAGTDGLIWVANSALSLGTPTVANFTTGGAFGPVSAHPSSGGRPRGLAVGSDGNMWATEFNNGKIARITSAGVMTEFTVPGGGQTLDTLGPDGNIWFTEAGGKIGKVTPAGVVTEYTVGGAPVGIATGPDGNLWVAAGSSIIRVLPSGVVYKSYPVPSGTAYDIALGPDGAMWFTLQGTDGIGRFNVAKG